MSTLTLPSHVFKAYDIRGQTPNELNPEFAYHLGRAFGSEVVALQQETVVVGRDGRLSSLELSNALIQGLSDCGLSVIDLGQVPTPIVYFGTHSRAQSGIQITGSHNPPAYNGFKMVLNQQAIYGATIQALAARMRQQDYCPQSVGTSVQVDSWLDYLERISDDVRLARPLKIVVDCGNGVAGDFAEPLYRTLGCEVIELFCTVDGRFPNHHPDPADPANLQDLITAVKAHQADVGFAFDGDGDRLGVVTAQGEIIAPDRQIILFARDILQRQPKAPIVFDVKCSRHVGLEVLRAGGQAMMCPTGHSLVKAYMREQDAVFGGEMSGHLFFSERWYGFDDALYAGARLLEIVSRSDDPSAILSALPCAAASTPELQCVLAEGENHRLIAAMQQQAQFNSARQVITIDGLRVEYADGFGLVRASNTMPVLVLRFEADSEGALARIQAEFKAQILAQKAEAVLPW